jgi:hypothetical protein
MISFSGRIESAFTQVLKSQDKAGLSPWRRSRTSLKNRIDPFQKEKLSAV